MSGVTNRNMYSLLRSRFPGDLDAPALILRDGEVSYRELHRESGRYANLLVTLGVRPGDRVAVQVEKTPQAIFLYLGCLRAGAVFLPMNVAYQRHEIGHFLEDAAPRLFVCRPQAREVADELAEELGVRHVLELEDYGGGELAEAAAAEPAEFPTVSRRSDDVAAILYTSGTTGRPKGAMLTHGNLAANALVLHSYWGFVPGDVLLHMLPIFHAHGLFVALHCALLNGSPILFEPRFDPKRALELLPKATVFMGVPTYYVRLLAEAGFRSELCSGMRLFVSGSAPLLKETFDTFRNRTGHTILERYGMTEGNMFISNPYHGERRGGTVGFPLPGITARIVDDAGAEVEPGRVGNLQVKGESVFAGYWNLPGRRGEDFTCDGFFRTGDLASRDADGYVTIIGRSKDLIISGGLNIYPKEVEDLIDMVPGVAETAVIGVPHPEFGEAVTAVVVREQSEQGEALNAGHIIERVKGVVAGFKVPKEVHFLAALPRNTMGKVQKNVLRERFR